MGYSFNVYAIELAKLKALWGSADAKLLEVIKKKQRAAISDNDESFAEQIEAEAAPSLGTALDEIVAGKTKFKDAGYQYGYALEVLCRHFGKRIDDEEMSWLDEFLDPFLKKAKQPDTGKLLCRDVHPLKIPAPDDFFEIGTLDDKALTRLGAALDAIAPAIEEDDGDDALEAVTEVRKWLAAAKKAKQQIVWFVY